MKKEIKKNYSWLIALIIGIAISVIMLIVGIVSLIKAHNINVPAMSDPNWFDISTKQSSLQFKGILFSILSVVMGLITAAISLTIKGVTKSPEELADEDAKEFQKKKRYIERMKQNNVEMSEDEIAMLYDGEISPDEQTMMLDSKISQKRHEKFCAYCGTKIKDGEIECSSCKAKITKK
ncbi:MAG: hypothetical protein ACI4L6_00355 [Candidatus Onthoplasma sp.]